MFVLLFFLSFFLSLFLLVLRAVGHGRYELAMGLVHPAPDYPHIGADSAEAFFADVDKAGLVEAAGAVFAEVTLGLLAFDPQRRLSLSEAYERLSQVGEHATRVEVLEVEVA